MRSTTDERLKTQHNTLQLRAALRAGREATQAIKEGRDPPPVVATPAALDDRTEVSFVFSLALTAFIE
jgi:hypothetical protein